MTTDQILLGVGLTLSLAVGCQILASRLTGSRLTNATMTGPRS